MNKSKAAYLFATETLGKQSLYMWTFTFREALDVKDTRKRWNHLLTLLEAEFSNLCGLRVFEMHEFHGLHVHPVTNRFLDGNKARLLAEQAGWGAHSCEAHPHRARGLPCEISQQGTPSMSEAMAAVGGIRKLGLDTRQRPDGVLALLDDLPRVQGVAGMDRQEGFLRQDALRFLAGNALCD